MSKNFEPLSLKAPMSALITVKNLQVEFKTKDLFVQAVQGCSFSIAPGETLGLVGESGSGKSVTALSLMRLIPSPPGQITGGEILLEGKNLLNLPGKSNEKSERKQDLHDLSGTYDQLKSCFHDRLSN